jgi:hypothetical protein
MQTVSVIDITIKSECSISSLEDPLLRQVMALIAAKYENKDLEKSIIELGPAPHRCLYTMEGSSQFGMLIDSGQLAKVVRHGWVRADKNMVFKAVSCSNVGKGIELFKAIQITDFDFTLTLYREVLPGVATKESEPQMVQYIIDSLIEKPSGSLIWNAVYLRKTGVIDIVRFLISRHANVNWMNSTPYGGWGDPREQAQMEHGENAKAGRETPKYEFGIKIPR